MTASVTVRGLAPLSPPVYVVIILQVYAGPVGQLLGYQCCFRPEFLLPPIFTIPTWLVIGSTLGPALLANSCVTPGGAAGIKDWQTPEGRGAADKTVLEYCWTLC